MEILLSEIVAIAINAGHSIMDVYATPASDVIFKADDSPLTLADLASDRIIGAGLARLSLGWPVISEESANIAYENRKDWQRFWLIDPLDGTKEFIKRNGEFTVNIALIEYGEPVLGVVYAPALEVCYFAARGVGAYVRYGQEIPREIHVVEYVDGEIVKLVASRSHSDARTHSLLQKFGDSQCISMGSSLKLCLVAEGLAHLYPRFGPTMEWDTAAAHAVVRYAGGRVCDLNGEELRYNKTNLHNPEFFVLSAADNVLLSFLKIK